MRTPALLALVALAASPAAAQPYAHFVWAKQLGSALNCEVVPEGVAVDSAGSVYVAGHFCGTTDVDPGPASHLLVSPATDAYVLKLDSGGNFVWVAQLGAAGFPNPQGVRAFDVALDAAGNVLVAGTFESTADFDPGPATFGMTAAGASDVFVVKLDPSGSLVWARQLGGSSVDHGDGIAVDANGAVLVVGEFAGTADFDPGPGIFSLTSAGFDDAFIAKLDSSGIFAWARRVGGAADDRARAVAVDGTIPYYVGSFAGTADFDPSAGTHNLVALGTRDIFVSKLTTGGSFQWARRLGGSSVSDPNDEAYDVAIGPFGSVLTVGEFSGTADFDPGPAAINLTAIGSAAFVSKLDAAGSFEFAKQFGGDTVPGPVARSVTFVLGQVVTVGTFKGTVDFDPGTGTYTRTSQGAGDAFVSQLHGSGDFRWASGLGGTGDDLGHAVAVTGASNILTVGTFRSAPADFDPGSSDFFLTPSGLGPSFVSRLSPEPIGGTVAGLTVRKSGATDVRLDWGVSCTPSMPAYGVYEGILGDFDSHSARACFFGPVTNTTLTPDPGNRYYLVVPNDDLTEGSYGRNSAGVERPQAAIGNCAAWAPVLGCP